MPLDLRHLWRTLRRSPASAGAAVLTLSLTIGAGAAIFAVVDAVLLTPPPFTDAGALVIAGEVPSDEPAARPRAIGYGTFEAWRERAGSMAVLEAFDGTNLTLTGLGSAERVSATDVTPGFLTLLGVRPARGRTFDRDDAGRPIAIVSEAFWRGKLAADPAVIGRQIMLGGRLHTVVGVLPDRFSFAISACEIWRPLQMTATAAARSGFRVGVVARLARGASAASLAAALEDVSRTASPPSRVVATPVASAIAGDATATLGLLAAAAALATLIAFINLSGLLIVRSIDRRRELAVRSALGAGRADIAKQLLLEATALVMMGTAGGVLLAFWMTPALGTLVLAPFGGVANRSLQVSWPVIGLVSLVAIACGCVCGSLPALGTTRWRVVDILRRGATPSPRELAVRRVFVTGEVALAFVLLVSMALLGRTLLAVLRVDPGLDPQNVLALQLSLPAASYPGRDRVAAFYSTLQRVLQERVGSRAVSLVDELPLTGDRGRSIVSPSPSGPGREAVVRAASPDYFDVMRIPVIAGRAFDWSDDSAAPPRVVMSEALAERMFARESAVGRRIWLASGAQAAEVVGVVGQVKHRALDEGVLPTVYLSALQAPSPSSIVVVRSARPDADVIATVREAVARLDGNLPVYGVRPMREVVSRSPGVPARRLLTAAFAGFALLAVVLSAIGLFGVAAHDVACRRTELALRIALGADPVRLLCATLGHGAVMVGAGLAVGVVLSLWAARGLSGMVVTARQSDALSIGLATAILVATGAAAVLPAALRAARTDPMIALRSE
ncbi:MAG TPA: ADOP family duplicated permease [Vicinamibacterales bacterium]|nr:ADOP family duplicated permease [Vicinamibacterales bacterium]